MPPRRSPPAITVSRAIYEVQEARSSEGKGFRKKRVQERRNRTAMEECHSSMAAEDLRAQFYHTIPGLTLNVDVKRKLLMMVMMPICVS